VKPPREVDGWCRRIIYPNLTLAESVILLEVPMTRDAQKREELYYLDEFLRGQLKLAVTELKPALKEPPDGSATFTNADGTTYLLDFEIAEYYVDDPRDDEGGSPSRRAKDFWDKVLAELVPRLEVLRLPVYLDVRLKDLTILKNKHVRQLADELIRFAQDCCPECHLERTRHVLFSAASYPLLHEHAEWISLTRHDDTYFLHWPCSNLAAAHVGPVTAYLRNHILRKSDRNFTWTPGAEKCLLLYASGGTVTSRGGPRPPDPSIWDDKDLLAACKDSVFDRIYFWERVRGWDERLK
jgi:hypothetical protein